MVFPYPFMLRTKEKAKIRVRRTPRARMRRAAAWIVAFRSAKVTLLSRSERQRSRPANGFDRPSPLAPGLYRLRLLTSDRRLTADFGPPSEADQNPPYDFGNLGRYKRCALLRCGDRTRCFGSAGSCVCQKSWTPRGTGGLPRGCEPIDPVRDTAGTMPALPTAKRQMLRSLGVTRDGRAVEGLLACVEALTRGASLWAASFCQPCVPCLIG